MYPTSNPLGSTLPTTALTLNRRPPCRRSHRRSTRNRRSHHPYRSTLRRSSLFPAQINLSLLRRSGIHLHRRRLLLLRLLHLLMMLMILHLLPLTLMLLILMPRRRSNQLFVLQHLQRELLRRDIHLDQLAGDCIRGADLVHGVGDHLLEDGTRSEQGGGAVGVGLGEGRSVGCDGGA